MKIQLLVFRFASVLFLFQYTVQTHAQAFEKGIKTIRADKIKQHVDYLASDSLKGRNTPSEGLTLAANYIETEFRRMHLKPVNESYTQPIPIVSLSLGNKNSVTISKNGVNKELVMKSEFIPFDIPADTTVKGQIVFAGYGITAPEYDYDDYKNVDVQGKIVFVLSHEPGENLDSAAFEGKHPTTFSDVKYKAENALRHGAAGMILITDPLNHMLILPRGYAWPTLSNPQYEDRVVFLKRNETSFKIPVVHVGQNCAEMLFGSLDSLMQIQQTIDSLLCPNSFPLNDTYACIQNSVSLKDPGCKNIVGFIQGSDPKLGNEILIIGAHYDHIGMKKTPDKSEDYIYNGADDNASGTSCLLAVAEAFAKTKTKPKRSILFIAFTGEEKGLYGSVSYVRKPLFPLERTIAILNLDMVGRNHIDTLYLEAAKISPDLTQLVEEQNEGIHFKIIRNGTEYLNASDHAPFYKKNIPFAFFTSGIHPDYHTVRDNPDLINCQKIEKIAKLVYKTALHIVNSDKYYKLAANPDNE